MNTFTKNFAAIHAFDLIERVTRNAKAIYQTIPGADTMIVELAVF
ncbi:hypothetical protein HNO89_000936 [Sporosarcina luteola]|nr:hypothetical protein [Sporosarcina luteola]